MIPDDPFYWYFSAALAIREGDADTAQSSIGKALKLAPSDPAILFEAGHVADFDGDDDRRAAIGCAPPAAIPMARSAKRRQGPRDARRHPGREKRASCA